MSATLVQLDASLRRGEPVNFVTTTSSLNTEFTKTETGTTIGGSSSYASDNDDFIPSLSYDTTHSIERYVVSSVDEEYRESDRPDCKKANEYDDDVASRFARVGRQHFRKACILFCVTATTTVAGILAGVFIQGWDVLTAVYATIQIVTTVGYGDITVKREEYKIFMTFYILALLILVACWLGLFRQYCLHRHEEFVQRFLALKQRAVRTQGNRSLVPGGLGKIPLYGSLFAVLTAVGTIFYRTYEACHCSYGDTKVFGCKDEDYFVCVETGGYTKSWAEAFYMSVVTLTTVGFGDHAPRSTLGRLLGCIWMILGCITTAMFVDSVSELLVRISRELAISKAEHDDSKRIFREMDRAGRGYLGRSDFLKYTLVLYDLVSQETFDEIDNLFNALDSAGGGRITHEAIVAANRGDGDAVEALRNFWTTLSVDSTSSSGSIGGPPGDDVGVNPLHRGSDDITSGNDGSNVSRDVINPILLGNLQRQPNKDVQKTQSSARAFSQ